jgi:hypothetical protein
MAESAVLSAICALVVAKDYFCDKSLNNGI